MDERKTILILTSKTGGGHISLAEALRDQLQQEYQIEINDPQPGFFHLHYRFVSRHALWLWAAEFRQLDTARAARVAHALFARLVARNLRALLQRTRPALIITTYPFLTSEVTWLLRRLGLKIPFVMLFADPNAVHASWLSEQSATATFAPTRESYQQALQAGFMLERLQLVGWPIRAQFHEAYGYEHTAILGQLELQPERFTVFLQGGGEGAAQFGQTVERVLAVGAQVILAAGTNRLLQERFKNLAGLAVLPFTREIAPYMAAADVVMGKAGPNTLFEAITLGKPFIASAYIPGQEQPNLEFIQRHALGWVALTPEEQHVLLTSLLQEHQGRQENQGSTELQAKRASVEAYRAWNMQANTQITPLIHALIAGDKRALERQS